MSFLWSHFSQCIHMQGIHLPKSCSGRQKEEKVQGTHISVMFSGSTLLGSNLGNATMPGEGSVHQILEALHLQDMGQAREALQKPTTSQHKPQSRAMADPCHLGQGDIPRRQCQSVRVCVPTLSPASPAGGGGGGREAFPAPSCCSVPVASRGAECTRG